MMNSAAVNARVKYAGVAEQNIRMEGSVRAIVRHLR